MTLKTKNFDVLDYLKTPEAISAYLNDAIETGTDDEILVALRTAAQAKGMAKVAKAAGVGRESLYKSLKEGAKPQFTTVMKIARAMGVTFRADATA